MSNIFKRLRDLVPLPPVLVGKVIAHHDDDTSTIEIPAGIGVTNYSGNVAVGSLIRARGRTVPVGEWAFVRAGVVETKAPGGAPIDIPVGKITEVEVPAPPPPPPPPPPPGAVLHEDFSGSGSIAGRAPTVGPEGWKWGENFGVGGSLDGTGWYRAAANDFEEIYIDDGSSDWTAEGYSRIESYEKLEFKLSIPDTSDSYGTELTFDWEHASTGAMYSLYMQPAFEAGALRLQIQSRNASFVWTTHVNTNLPVALDPAGNVFRVEQSLTQWRLYIDDVLKYTANINFSSVLGQLPGLTGTYIQLDKGAAIDYLTVYPPETPAEYVNDTFDGDAGTSLAAHTPEVGGPWGAALGGSASNVLLDGAGYVYDAPGGPTGTTITTTANPEGDYYVEIEGLFPAGVTPSTLVGIIAFDNATNWYGLTLSLAGDGWLTYRVSLASGGLNDQFVEVGFTPGVPFVLRAEFTNAGQTVTIKKDGTTVGQHTLSGVPALALFGFDVLHYTPVGKVGRFTVAPL